MMRLKPLASFAAGFAGMGALWGGFAGILDAQNGGVLSTQILDLFTIPSPVVMMLIVTTIGGLLGGLGSVTGAFGRELIEGEAKN